MPGQGPSGPPPQRPITVTLAAALMMLQVLLGLIGSIVLVVSRDSLKAAITKQLLTDPNVSRSDIDLQTLIDTTWTISMVVGIGVALVSAIVFSLLALFNLRGKNVARIITWVICGLLLCCSPFSLYNLTSVDTSVMPGWYVPYTIAVVVLNLLIYIGIIVLLLLPPSNRFFKPAK